MEYDYNIMIKRYGAPVFKIRIDLNPCYIHREQWGCFENMSCRRYYWEDEARQEIVKDALAELVNMIEKRLAVYDAGKAAGKDD